MSDPEFSAIPTREQLDALGSALQRVSLGVQKEARVVSDTFIDAAIHWRRTETLQMEQWHRKQRNGIRRQLLDRDTTHFGRKRRARRARGWRIDQQQRDQSYFGWIMNRIRGEVAATGVVGLNPFHRISVSYIVNPDAYTDPRLGEPWPEEQAQQGGPDEADQDSH